MSLAASEILFVFDSATEPSSDVTNFLNMIYHYTENSFLRKYYMLTSSQVKKVSLKTLRRKWYSVELRKRPCDLKYYRKILQNLYINSQIINPQ